MTPERKSALAVKIGKKPEEVSAAILTLLDATAADSPIQARMLAGLASCFDASPNAREFEAYFIGLAKGMQYVHEQFPNQTIGRVQFVAEMRDERGELLPPKLAYDFRRDILLVNTSMAALSTIASRRKEKLSMPLTRDKVFSAEEVAFLSGVEEAYHAVQHKNPGIRQRLEFAQNHSSFIVTPQSDMEDMDYAANAYERDAAEFRQKVAGELKMGASSASYRAI